MPHTKGEWHVADKQTGEGWWVKCGQETVAVTSFKDAAHLIAAAPAMLSALEAIVKRSPFVPTATGLSVSLTFEQVQMAQEAIRAAKGEESQP